MIREERAAERERVRYEKETEREQLRTDRDRARRLKQSEKAEQKQEWRSEVEDYQSQDDASLNVGNESPEVEDRDGLFAELLKEREWIPPVFEPPPLPASIRAKHREEADARATEAARTFNHPARALDIAQSLAASGAVSMSGISLLPLGWPPAPALCLCSLLCWLTLEAFRRSSHSRAETQHVARALEAAERDFAHNIDIATAEFQAQALSDFEQANDVDARAYRALQAQRLAQVRALLAGDIGAIHQELADIFPLDLHPTVAVEPDATPTALRLRLRAPFPEALQPDSASLLASGKPKYKRKTQKQLRAEGQRYIAGLALRHASEALLHIPTATSVFVSVEVTTLDPARGTEVEAEILSVTYGFGTLAPLQMADIDPIAALSHFEHIWSEEPLEREVKRMVSR